MSNSRLIDFTMKRGPWRHFLVWFVFYVSCFVSTDHYLIASTLFAGGLSIALVYSAAVSVSVPRTWKILTVTAYWVVAGVTLVSALTYGLRFRKMGPVDADAMRAIAQTDLLEAVSYLGLQLSWEAMGIGAVVAILLFMTFPFSVSRAELGLTSPRSSILPAIAALTMLVGGGVPIFKPIYHYVTNYKEQLALFRSVLAARNSQLPDNVSSEFEGTIVIIIGESTTRRHMSIYNYFRDTTPFLSAREEELVVFQDVVAPHTQTVPVLTNALTLAGTDPQLSFYSSDAIDIVSLAKAAGFETFWFSNQNEFGIWDNPISAIAHSADHTRFFSPTLGKVFRRLLHDQEMLPFVGDVLSSSTSPRKVVFVHLFATHWPYCDTYPSSFQYFDEPLGEAFFGRAREPSKVNCYDNAVRYVDWLVDSIIQRAERESQPVGLLYFSDHGEAPLLGLAHEPYPHSSFQVEVPFILWANAAYTRRYPETMLAARRNAEFPYSSSRLFHTLGDLMHIESDLLIRRHSVFSSDYMEQKRIILNGKIPYDEWSDRNDYIENARIFSQLIQPVWRKVWSHRTNSLGALMEAKEIFSGVEIDLVFDSDDNRFHVGHPPAPDTGLVLEDMLATLRDRPDMRFWFDWKNASAINIEAAITRLNELDRSFDITSRSLIETGSDAVFRDIRSISTAGYLHGYYLPTEQILTCLTDCSEDEQRDLAKIVIERIKLGNYGAITYDWRLNAFVRRWLDDFVKKMNIKQFSWDLSINVSRSFVRADDVITRANNLDALLVVFPSIFKI